MLYRTGETITFVAYYTNSGAAATGLTVTANIYKVGGGGSSIASPSVTEEGGGFYSCTYTPSSDGVYMCVFTTSGTVDQSDIAAVAYRGIGGLNHLDADISSVKSEPSVDIYRFAVGEPPIFYYKTTTDISSLDLGSEIEITGHYIGDSLGSSGSEVSLSNTDFEIKIIGTNHLYVFIKPSSVSKRGYGSISIDISSGTETFTDAFVIGSDWNAPVKLTYGYNEQDKILTLTRTPLNSSGDVLSDISPRVDSFVYDEDNAGRVREVNEDLE